MDLYDKQIDDILFGEDVVPSKSIPWNFTLRDEVIMTPGFNETLRRIARLHKRSRETGLGGSLLITAQSGVGKSTALRYYADQFPPQVLKDRTIVPVVYAITPSNPTDLSLMDSILVALGDSTSGGKTAAKKRKRIIELMVACETQLLMIDEIQHFDDRNKRAESRKVTDSFKLLLEALKLPVILAGLPRSSLFVISNMQLQRRSSAWYEFKPFGFHTETEIKIFRGFLNKNQERLPVKCIALRDARIAERFYYASAGIIDYIIKILDAAVLLASELERSIDLPLLAEVYRQEVWADAPDSLNPFVEGAHLRELKELGEPFSGWDRTNEKNREGAKK